MSRREYFKDYRMLNNKVMDSLESKGEIESYDSSNQSNEDNFSDETMLLFLSQETSNVPLTEDTADSSYYLDRESIYEDSYAISSDSNKDESDIDDQKKKTYAGLL